MPGTRLPPPSAYGRCRVLRQTSWTSLCRRSRPDPDWPLRGEQFRKPAVGGRPFAVARDRQQSVPPTWLIPPIKLAKRHIDLRRSDGTQRTDPNPATLSGRRLSKAMPGRVEAISAVLMGSLRSARCRARCRHPTAFGPGLLRSLVLRGRGFQVTQTIRDIEASADGSCPARQVASGRDTCSAGPTPPVQSERIRQGHLQVRCATS
jgi:hypothetical protein